MGEAKEAITYYQSAIKIDKEVSDVYFNLANAYYFLNEIDQAITNYKRAVSLNP